MTYQLLQGDCLDAMTLLEAASVDALICDPPAGISFMGRDFDHHRGGRDLWIAWLAERLSAARRVLKPGHYGLVWALPRTSHWTGMACEDAGFVVIDRVSHIFGQGFPKGKNKLKPAVEDWWLIRAPGPVASLHIDACRVKATPNDVNERKRKMIDGNAYSASSYMVPGVEIGWDGKAGRWPPHLILSHAPGCVPIGVKRVRGTKGEADYSPGKPALIPAGCAGGTVKTGRHYADADGRETVSDWRCQPGCPVRELGEMSGELTGGAFPQKWGKSPTFGQVVAGERDERIDVGDTGTAARFFPNLDPPAWECAPGCPIRQMDEMSGESSSSDKSTRGASSHIYGGGNGFTDATGEPVGYGDTGGASRFYPNLDPPFFYAAKASRRERGAGCDDLYWLADDTRGSGYRPIEREEYEAAQAAGERVARGNMHPTVKNIKLLTWLINLLTVPGDVILDPFAGSGSIGVAAIAGGRSFVGVEMDEDYLSICEARLAQALAQPRQLEIAV